METSNFSKEWLSHKPKFNLHQRVRTLDNNFGRVLGVMQTSDGPHTIHIYSDRLTIFFPLGKN